MSDCRGGWLVGWMNEETSKQAGRHHSGGSDVYESLAVLIIRLIVQLL